MNRFLVYSSQIVWDAGQLATNISNQHLENSLLYDKQFQHMCTKRDPK